MSKKSDKFYAYRRYSRSDVIRPSTSKKLHMVARNYVCAATANGCGSSRDEIAISVQFKRSMRIDNRKRKELMAPIAKYDVAKQLAYLEYPDGRIVYAE